MKKLLSTALLGLTIAATATAASATERWRVQLSVPETLPEVGQWFTDWAKTVNDGDSDLQVKLFNPGEIVGPLVVLDAVRDGKVPAGIATLNFSSGFIPAAPLLTGVPFGMGAAEYASWYYYGGGEQLTVDLLAKHGVHAMLCFLTGAEVGGWFREPITTVDQLQGLKFRTSGLAASVFEKVGASVTALPSSEVFPALEKNVIDAAEFSLPVVDKLLGFYKVAPYAYLPGWHQPMAGLHLVVNQEVWDGLSGPQKNLLETSCEATAFKSHTGLAASQGDAVAALTEAGAKFQTYSPEIMAAFEAATKEVLAEEAAKDADFKAIHDSMVAHRAKLKAWSDMNPF